VDYGRVWFLASCGGKRGGTCFSGWCASSASESTGLAAGLSIIVEGGDLAIEECIFGAGRSSLDGRTLEAISSSPRAVDVIGGAVRIARSRFSNLDGGAISVRSGSLDVNDCTLDDNSAPHGGALLVTGGLALLMRTLFQKNSATTSGGALQVDGGVVELASATQFVGNSAPRGASLCAARCIALELKVITIPFNRRARALT
jgi:predicted outer membrane repeat protein